MERERLVKLVAVTAEAIAAKVSPDAIAIICADLDDGGYADSDINAAMARVRRECKGRLPLADILERLPNQPMGADAAWNKALEARIWDEDTTVILPRAICASFPHELWNQGDKIGARMAFKDIYPQARQTWGEKIQVSPGWDRKNVRPALQAAVEKGLLSLERAMMYLPSGVDALTPPQQLVEAGETTKQLTEKGE